jgi:tetratricopeptide (TPR) repeat protein
MIRLGRVSLALVLLLLLLPMAAEAQRDNRYTREATKFIGLAMTRQEPGQRTDMYRQAMAQLREAMQQEPNNARVWLLSGQVHAALGEMEEADQAFTRAVELHPQYAEEVAGEREAAWMEAFNAGIELMNAGDYPGAIARMEGAQLIYTQRPEALMNLGALYANRGDNPKAAQAFGAAIEAIQGPLAEQLDDDTREAWQRYREMALVNVAQITAAEGVAAFEARDFEAAARHFRQAAEINPYSRDYLYNQVQSLWALAGELEDVVEAAGPEAAGAKARLLELYPQIEELAVETRKVDPNSELLYLIQARSVRMRGEMGTTPAERDAGQRGALQLLQQHDALAVVLDDLAVMMDGEEVTVSGALKNRKHEAGAPVQVEFTLLGIDGQVIGQEVITVTAPAVEETAEFRASVPLSGELAGWRYAVRG